MNKLGAIIKGKGSYPYNVGGKVLSRRVVYSILHRILYFLPVGERGVCWWWKRREKRMIDCIVSMGTYT